MADAERKRLERQKEWTEQFGDHAECSVCGTACEMLFVDEPRTESGESGLRSLIRELRDTLAQGQLWLKEAAYNSEEQHKNQAGRLTAVLKKADDLLADQEGTKP